MDTLIILLKRVGLVWFPEKTDPLDRTEDGIGPGLMYQPVHFA